MGTKPGTYDDNCPWIRGTICLAQSALIRATLRRVFLLIQLSWKSANPPFHHCCWDVVMDFPSTCKFVWCARTVRRAGGVAVGSYTKIISDMNTNKQAKGMYELMVLILLTFKGPSVVRNWVICAPSKPTQRRHNVLECGGGMWGAQLGLDEVMRIGVLWHGDWDLYKAKERDQDTHRWLPADILAFRTRGQCLLLELSRPWCFGHNWNPRTWQNCKSLPQPPFECFQHTTSLPHRQN